MRYGVRLMIILEPVRPVFPQSPVPPLSNHLQTLLQSPDIAAHTARLAESLQVVERVLEQVKDISLNLRPSMLDDLGLESTLRWYTHTRPR